MRFIVIVAVLLTLSADASATPTFASTGHLATPGQSTAQNLAPVANAQFSRQLLQVGNLMTITSISGMFNDPVDQIMLHAVQATNQWELILNEAPSPTQAIGVTTTSWPWTDWTGNVPEQNIDYGDGLGCSASGSPGCSKGMWSPSDSFCDLAGVHGLLHGGIANGVDIFNNNGFSTLTNAPVGPGLFTSASAFCVSFSTPTRSVPLTRGERFLDVSSNSPVCPPSIQGAGAPFPAGSRCDQFTDGGPSFTSVACGMLGTMDAWNLHPGGTYLYQAPEGIYLVSYNLDGGTDQFRRGTAACIGFVVP